MNTILRKIIFIAIVLALVFGFAYVLVQQVLRQGANDPQIQIAEDAVVKLARGEAPDFLRSNVYGDVDMAKSLAPFMITFDGTGKVLASNVTLNGITPVPPAGVFAYTKKHGEDRVTWQPAKGVRIAAVVVYYGGQREGYALAGRSLTEVEKRAGGLNKLLVMGWLFSVLASSVFILYNRKRSPVQRFNYK